MRSLSRTLTGELMSSSEQRREHEEPAVEPADETRERSDTPAEPEGDRKANPPNTTKDGVTAPKFGSAGSGGAEYEPAPGT